MDQKSEISGTFIIGQRRGQLTLFIILSIILVVVIIVLFFWVRPDVSFSRTSQLNFEGCVVDATRQSITELSLTGGENDPEFYYEYEGERVPYYCYTSEVYKTCIVQRPLVKQFFEKELIKHLTPKVNLCYQNSIDELRDLGYNVTSGDIQLNLTIIPERITIDVNAPTTIAGQRFTSYKMSINSNMYEVLFVATSILQYESSYGDSPISELMYYYPDLIVDKVRRGDATKVYVITDKATEDKFQFASKSLVWPAGYDTR
jgi:hypothetical protein